MQLRVLLRENTSDDRWGKGNSNSKVILVLCWGLRCEWSFGLLFLCHALPCFFSELHESCCLHLNNTLLLLYSRVYTIKKKGNYSFSLLFYVFFLLFELSYALIHTAYNSKSQAQGQILVLPRCRTLHSRPGRSPANNATSPWPTRSVRRPCAARCARPSRRFSSSALPAYAAAVFLFFRRTRAWPCVHDAARWCRFRLASARAAAAHRRRRSSVCTLTAHPQSTRRELRWLT